MFHYANLGLYQLGICRFPDNFYAKLGLLIFPKPFLF
jgi:hypothetical protein